jgi:hypothetical protein
MNKREREKKQVILVPEQNRRSQLEVTVSHPQTKTMVSFVEALAGATHRQKLYHNLLTTILQQQPL